MTHTNPKRFDSDVQSDEVFRYLLGELDNDARLLFEKRLADEPDFCETLLQQATLIAAIGQTSDMGVPSLASVGVISLARPDGQRWRWIATLVSIAACVAMISLVNRFATPEKTVASSANSLTHEQSAGIDETTLIARAWASNHATASSEHEDLTDQSDSDRSMDDALDLAREEPTREIDSSLSWIYVAISSNLDLNDREGNDG